jgi:hypothetical protein
MSRLGGVEGNERLTDSLALVLFALLGLEALTTLDLSGYLAVHIFLGLLLLPLVSLKVASTAWRAGRYYGGSHEYRAKGPPRLVPRLLAPPLVAATTLLFATGVAFLATGRRGGLLLTLHAASFAVWGGIMVVHVLWYLPRVARHGLADWLRPFPGGSLRRALVLGGVVVGAVVALATYSVQDSWLDRPHHHDHHRAR